MQIESRKAADRERNDPGVGREANAGEGVEVGMVKMRKKASLTYEVLGHCSNPHL